MGFRPPKRVYKLEFATQELDGLEVKAESLSIRKYTRMVELAGKVEAADNSTPVAVIEELLTGFVDNAISWNLEDERGVPVDITLDNLKDQKTDMVLQIIVAWLDAIAGVSDPLSVGSKNGGTSQEQSLGLAAISQSRAS